MKYFLNKKQYKFDLLLKTNRYGAEKLLYEWVKLGSIGFLEFRVLLHKLDEKDERQTNDPQ